jgi:hypothetical protein
MNTTTHSPVLISGPIGKMSTALADGVASYALPVGDTTLDMSTIIGKQVTLSFVGTKTCIHCGSEQAELHIQGYCRACSVSLAKCDSCSVSPEKCHYAEGTCREPSWGETNCLVDHIVYLSYTSGFKVGVTRSKNIPDRWIDQGATVAVPLFRTSQRLIAGLIECEIKSFMADKTQWRQMLMSDDSPSLDTVIRAANDTIAQIIPFIKKLQDTYKFSDITTLTPSATEISYPLFSRPAKIGMPHNLDKSTTISGPLRGVKGQYLFIGDTVINVRKYSGYHMAIGAE